MSLRDEIGRTLKQRDGPVDSLQLDDNNICDIQSAELF